MHPAGFLEPTHSAAPGRSSLGLRLSQPVYPSREGHEVAIVCNLLPPAGEHAAMESNEQEVAEMLRWFDRYVKNAAPREGSGPQPLAR